MKNSAYNAAALLMTKLRLPAGRVNTMVESTKSGSRIRVLVDKTCRVDLSSVPKTFMGFRVVVDEREPMVAHY